MAGWKRGRGAQERTFVPEVLSSSQTMIATSRMDTMLPSVDCSERDRLQSEVVRSLQDVVEFSEILLNAINIEQPISLDPLDRDLQKAIAAKERAFEALSRHREEHGC